VHDVVYWHARKAIRATGYDHGSVYTFYWDQATGVLLEERIDRFGIVDTSTTLVRTNAFDVSIPAGGNAVFPLVLVIGLAAVIVTAFAVSIDRGRKAKPPTRTVQKMQARTDYAMPGRHRITREVLHITDLKAATGKCIEKIWRKKGTILWILLLLFPPWFVLTAFYQAGGIFTVVGTLALSFFASYVMIMMTPFGWVWLPLAIFVTMYMWGRKREEKELMFGERGDRVTIYSDNNEQD
jgi:hypothetical protein